VPLGGWYVRDAGLRQYTFPPHATIAPGATITVTVGWDGDDQSVFAWGEPKPIFTNPTSDGRAAGDGAYLFDTRGNVRAATVFPCRWRCTDPRSGAISIAVDPTGRNESVSLTNVSGAPVDLDGAMLQARPGSYHFAPRSVIPPGATMRISSFPDPAGDTALEKGRGLGREVLRDRGGVARLLTYTDITLACAAWGERAC
jgi:hypothetical protein